MTNDSTRKQMLSTTQMAEINIPGIIFQNHKIWEAQGGFLRLWFPTSAAQQTASSEEPATGAGAWAPP